MLPARKIRIKAILPDVVNISATDSMVAFSTGIPIATMVRDGLVSSHSGKGAVRRTLVPASFTSKHLDCRQA